MPPLWSKTPTILAATLMVLAAGLATFPASAQEVRVVAEYGVVNSSAAAYCPPDDGASVYETTETIDLEDYAHTASSDTTSACGISSGLGSLATRITGSTIAVDMSCMSMLAGHRGSQGAARFEIIFEVTSPVAYTMSVQGSFAYEISVGRTGWHIGLNGVHEIVDGEPDVDVTWSGYLEPGTYTLEGNCLSGRATVSNFGDLWLWGDGTAILTGAVRLEFSDPVGGLRDNTSLGSLKARYR